MCLTEFCYKDLLFLCSSAGKAAAGGVAARRSCVDRSRLHTWLSSFNPLCVRASVCLSKGKSNLLARRVRLSRSPWATLSSHLTCVYLPISTWADITSAVWSVEAGWMSRKCG